MRNFRYFVSVIVLTCTGVAAQVSPTMPAPNRNMTAPSRHLPPGGDHPESTAGTIEGFVYWDVNTVRHMPANSCSGLAITVSVGNSSGGPLTAYTPLGTLSNNFKYVGEVKEFLVGGKVNVFDVCTYGYDKVPVGPDLQVTLTVAQSGEFLPGAVPQFATLGPIKIINAQCNMLPRIVNPTASDLTAHWGSCQNMAYDVNFVMLKTPRQQLGLASPPPGSSGSPGGMLSGAPQQGMLSSGATQNGQSQSNSGALLRNQQVATGQSGIQQNPGSKVELNPQPFPPRQQLTNADVIKMVKAGVPEAAIVSSIQSSPIRFDLSPQAQLTLHRAGVSQKVLDAMMAEGSAKRGTVSRTIKLGPAKTGEIIKNPRAAQGDTTIIAVLEKQKQSAQLEASQMVRTVVRPVGMQAGASQPMSATTTNEATAPTAATMQRSSTPGTISTGKVSNSPGNSVASLAPVSQVQTIALTCATEPAMRILNVSGEFYPATFTPDAKYNFYTITGCSFGDSGPNSKVYIYYQDIFRQDFQIQEWNDNGIKLNLNPSLKGVLDQDNLTLVVQRNDGKQATKGGFKFYAAREMTLLGRIPQAAFSLNHFTLTNTTDLQVTYTSPSSPNVIPDVSGYTAEVSWECTDCSANPDHPNFAHWAPSGEDIYQFKNLQPGFIATQAAMASVDASCQGTLHREGNFGLSWVEDDLHATWQGQTCQWSGCGGFGQPDCFGQGPGSNYAVNVWVTGPRGVDPWTGKPN
ncbi:MAG: hypothetical protein WA830_25410 [Candidatus Sulfotelmatobacter sp.]